MTYNILDDVPQALAICPRCLETRRRWCAAIAYIDRGYAYYVAVAKINKTRPDSMLRLLPDRQSGRIKSSRFKPALAVSITSTVSLHRFTTFVAAVFIGVSCDYALSLSQRDCRIAAHPVHPLLKWTRPVCWRSVAWRSDHKHFG